MFHVWELRIKLLKFQCEPHLLQWKSLENPDSILYVLQWVMIYSFGINTDLRIYPKSIPHTGVVINHTLLNPHLFTIGFRVYYQTVTQIITIDSCSKYTFFLKFKFFSP